MIILVLLVNFLVIFNEYFDYFCEFLGDFVDYFGGSEGWVGLDGSRPRRGY